MNITMRSSRWVKLLVGAGLAWESSLAAALGVVNGSFESPRLTPGVADWFPIEQSQVPGWRTTASDGQIEFWTDGFMVPAYAGHQFIELNANEVSTVFQDISGFRTGRELRFSFAHRGRLGVDTLRLSLTDLGSDNAWGSGDDTVLFSQVYASSNQSWSVYRSQSPIVPLGHQVRISFESLSAAGQIHSYGNLVDAVHLAPVPEPGTASLALLGASCVLAATRRRRSAG